MLSRGFKESELYDYSIEESKAIGYEFNVLSTLDSTLYVFNETMFILHFQDLGLLREERLKKILE
jgi:hypothetical protein